MKPDLIELSKQAAEVLGELAITTRSYFDDDIGGYIDEDYWLAEDSGRCAEIAADKKINTYWYLANESIEIQLFDDPDWIFVEVSLADYNGDRHAAWRAAVLMAVIEQAKGETS